MYNKNFIYNENKISRFGIRRTLYNTMRVTRR